MREKVKERGREKRTINLIRGRSILCSNNAEVNPKIATKIKKN